MKNRKNLQIILCAALLTSAIPLAASAAEDVVYGTMQIPYSEFYSSEGLASGVDAVSSATTSKWKNENLTAGTYNTENADGSGVINGVVYPVAISSADLDALGENNYGFTPLESTPAAYKEVTVSSGKASFSEVKGETAAITGVTAELATETNYGDYCIDAAVNNANGTSDVGRIFGIVLETANGDKYGMRHLENIWRDEIAWSVGFVTEERHGNKLSYENYASIAGQTITKITYITDSGYHTLDTELYVPVKFENTLEVSDADISAGKTSVKLSGFPTDYNKQYSVEGLNGSANDSSVTYSNALPGKYTLTVSDASGKYADVNASFTLSTASVPADVSDSGIVKADGVSDADYANFMKNISAVTVGETSYAASGKRSVKIIGEDGSIDASAASGENKVFANDGEYELSVASTGYNNALTFKATVKDSKIVSLSDSNTAKAPETSAAKNDSVDHAAQTPDAFGAVIAAAVISGAAALGIAVRKKKD